MALGRPSWEDESHNTSSLFGGPERLEPLRAIVMDSQNGKRSDTPDSDSLFPSEMEEEETAPELVKQDRWHPARKSSEGSTTCVSQVSPWPKKIPRFSHFIYDRAIQLPAWNPKVTTNWTGSNLAGSVVWSRRAKSFSHHGEGQHAAATATGPLHCPMGEVSPKPWAFPTLPGNTLNFVLEKEEQVPDIPAKPAEKAPLIGHPRGWDSGLHIWGQQTPRSPKWQHLSCFGAQEVELLRARIMGGKNGKGSQTHNKDSSISSEMEEEVVAPEQVQQDPWYPPRKFSGECSTWVPEIGPRLNPLSRLSQYISDPELKQPAWSCEESASSLKMGSNHAGSLGWSMQANSFCHQGGGQHTAATAARPFHCPVGGARPEPWFVPTLPRDLFNFPLVEEEEEPAASAKPAENTPVPLKQPPWYLGVKFSANSTTWESEVGRWPNTLSSLSQFIYDPEDNLFAWTPDESPSCTVSSIPGSVTWSRRTNRVCYQGGGQHTAATAARPFHFPMARPRPEPWFVPPLPRDFFNNLLDEEEEEEVPNNSANPALKTPVTGSPRGWYSGCFMLQRCPPHDPSPELLPLSYPGQDSEAPAPPSRSFRPPVFRACRCRLVF